jgi:hypothetical protein
MLVGVFAGAMLGATASVAGGLWWTASLSPRMSQIEGRMSAMSVRFDALSGVEDQEHSTDAMTRQELLGADAAMRERLASLEARMGAVITATQALQILQHMGAIDGRLDTHERIMAQQQAAIAQIQGVLAASGRRR